MFVIPDYVKIVLDKLNNAGYGAYLAGGSVRDYLMGKTPSDYDIASSAFPEETKAVFCGFPVIETGIKHGTVTVVSNGKNIEITTFRIDGDYADGRHPKSVMFSRELSEDLKRRDFTVNAMAYSPKSGIVDLFGGKEDIKNKVIRCVGEADRRFSEDALRILRGLRFSSVLGFSIAPSTAKSIHKNKNLLEKISKERIFSELKKLLCGKCAGEVLQEFSDVAKEVIPQFCEINEEKYAFICDNIGSCGNDVKVRLSFFLSGFDEKIASDILHTLKADNKTISFVKNTIEALSKPLRTKPEIKRFLRKNSYEILSAVIKINNFTENNSMDETKRLADEIIKNGECYLLSQLALNGSDIISMGYTGSDTGKILEMLFEAVITERLENKREILQKYIKKA